MPAQTPPLLVARHPLAPGCAEPSYDDQDPCAALQDPVEFENCSFLHIAPLWDQDQAAFRGALADLPSPASRDLIRMRTIATHPGDFESLCTDVETDDARRYCQTRLGRPHLQQP